MATRNLTKKFLEIRNAAKANRSLGVKDEGHDDDGGLLSKVSINLIFVLQIPFINCCCWFIN